MLVALLLSTHGEVWRKLLRECEDAKGECDRALERVPPAEWRRVADELAECKQHLDRNSLLLEETSGLMNWARRGFQGLKKHTHSVRGPGH